MKVFVVRAEFGKYTEQFKKGGFVGIGWFPAQHDLSTKENIKDVYRKYFPDDANMRINQNSGQINRFINEIHIGDIVITPFSYNRLLIGKVESDVYFEKDDFCPYNHRKKVKWLEAEFDRQSFSIPLQNTLRSSLTCFSVNQANEILKAIGEIPNDSSTNSSNILDIKTLYNSLWKKCRFHGTITSRHEDFLVIARSRQY